MPIIFSVVSRGDNILAKHAICDGNFDEVAGHILPIISAHQHKAITFAQDSYLIHYIRENGFVYMCIADHEFARSKAFFFLTGIKRRFREAYGDDVLSALPYVINMEFSLIMANEMKQYNGEKVETDGVPADDAAADASSSCAELDEIREVLTRSVDKTAMSNQNVRLVLVGDARHFPRPVRVAPGEQHPLLTSQEQRRTSVICWAVVVFNTLLMIVVVIYLVVADFCGFSLQKCGE